MNGVCLTFYAYELEKHEHRLIHEWLLELGKTLGIPGGSVMRGIAGFGRNKKLHEEHFFELAANVPIEIKFILSKEDAEKLIALVRKEKQDLFYTLSNIDYDFT